MELAGELRQELLSSVSKTGGHLSTNLGSVELTIALHYVYNLPTDKLIWDVSNQTYSHKILTGRRDRMDSIRQFGGLSGFARRDESPHDHFGAGHASTSISAALGFAIARDNAGEDHSVVAIIGDGAMTGGLAFEGLNNAGSSKSNLLVILNDNSWSISKNVGALSKYLTSITTDEKFNKLRNEVWELTGRFKRRDKIRETISNLEDSIKGMLVPGMLFQKMGFRYFGPIDGHDLQLLTRTLEKMKDLSGPLMLHVATVKGKGYEPAEGNPTKYHGVGKFDKITGQMEASPPGRPSYTQVFGKAMLEVAAKDKRVVAITAAMTPGTGLVEFAQTYPDRLFDVGIAEGHAGTFAAGLAAGGARPYLTIYSTFMQRAFDQVVHDIALQKLPVVICMDRGGLAGADGPTHHGVFDLTYMATIPDLVVAVPKDGNELRSMMHYTIDNHLPGPVTMRYPRDSVPTDMIDAILPIEWGKWEMLSSPSKTYLIACGTMVATALKAMEWLREKEIDITVINARFVKPLDMEMIEKIGSQADTIVTLEENALRGGVGEAIASKLLERGYSGQFKAMGIPDRFVEHGGRDQLLRDIGLDVQTVSETVLSMARISSKGSGGILRRLRLKKSNESVERRTPTQTGVAAADDQD